MSTRFDPIFSQSFVSFPFPYYIGLLYISTLQLNVLAWVRNHAPISLLLLLLISKWARIYHVHEVHWKLTSSRRAKIKEKRIQETLSCMKRVRERETLLPHHCATHYYSISSSWFPAMMGPKRPISAHSSLAETIRHGVFRDRARRDELKSRWLWEFSSARFISSFISGGNTKSLSSLISLEIVNFDLFGDTRFPCLAR